MHWLNQQMSWEWNVMPEGVHCVLHLFVAASCHRVLHLMLLMNLLFAAEVMVGVTGWNYS